MTSILFINIQGWEELYKQHLEKSWEERIKEYKERGSPKLMKWDPTNPKNKETYEPGARTYDDADDLDVMVSKLSVIVY